MNDENSTNHWMEPLFLGSYAENNDFFEHLLLEHLRDHFYWRRNFHPTDSPSIPTDAAMDSEFQKTSSKIRKELHELSAKLKQSIPFFHPRYVGHMASDLFLPSLIAQMITTLYNPNNVSTEAATVTIDMELEVGKEFASLFGFNICEDKYPCAWGHLTSGGTVANIEALWNIRGARFLGFAIARACDELNLTLDVSDLLEKPLSAMNDWELFNLSIDTALSLWDFYLKSNSDKFPLTLLEKTLDNYRPESIGMAAFSQLYWTVKSPLILVPATAHYSWKKAAQMLGLGSQQMVQVPVDRHMRMNADALERILNQAVVQQTPILGVVAVLGTTEFGTIDPLHRIVELQQKCRGKGLYFPIHVDAAWGGYLTTLFRQEDGDYLSLKEMSETFKYFPGKDTYNAFTCLHQVDSITIDPHKLGYMPFGVGGVIYRNKLISKIQSQKAAYVFDNKNAETGFRNLGQFILEGSKPGASAAAVYISQKIMPLHNKGMGKLLEISINNAEYFYDKFMQFKEKIKHKVHISMPVEPDTNLVTLSINPVGNKNISLTNHFTWSVYQSLKFDSDRPVQTAEYLGSSTKLFRSNLTTSEATRLSIELGFDVNSFVKKVDDKSCQADYLFALRHTLMNPWSMRQKKGKNFIDGYLEFLECTIEKVLLQVDINDRNWFQQEQKVLSCR